MVKCQLLRLDSGNSANPITFATKSPRMQYNHRSEIFSLKEPPASFFNKFLDFQRQLVLPADIGLTSVMALDLKRSDAFAIRG